MRKYRCGSCGHRGTIHENLTLVKPEQPMCMCPGCLANVLPGMLLPESTGEPPEEWLRLSPGATRRALAAKADMTPCVRCGGSVTWLNGKLSHGCIGEKPRSFIPTEWLEENVPAGEDAAQAEFQHDREVIEGAVAGPWDVWGDVADVDRGYEEDGDYCHIACCVTGEDETGASMQTEGDMANADFIARARTRWPAALDEVERLQGLLAGACDTLEKYQAALRQTDVIRHRMKVIGRRSPAMQELVDQLKEPCMVAFVR